MAWSNQPTTRPHQKKIAPFGVIVKLKEQLLLTSRAIANILL
jgi:hypothetical protein